MTELTAILKEHALKVTPQRLSIFKILYDTKSHPSAETIYKSIHESQPTMSLATVYKTLDTLVKHGLIQQLNVGEDSYRYDADTSAHPHIKCTCCGNVYDMPNVPGIDDLRENVRQATRFKLTSEQLYFFGVCPDCQ